jgi:hypothetical protein
MTTAFDKWWMGYNGSPPRSIEEATHQEVALRAWDAAVRAVAADTTNSLVERNDNLVLRNGALEKQLAVGRETVVVLRGQIRGLLVERDEFERKAQRHEELRRQAERQCDRIRKRGQEDNAYTIGLMVEGTRDMFNFGEEPGQIDPETVSHVCLEVKRAREKFPSNRHLLAALTEEVGELAEALLDNQGKDREYAEAMQVACVAIRIMEEGDSDFDG